MGTITTKRVTGTPSGGATSRVTLGDSLLLLEGDESGFLLLEGDAQGVAGDEALVLEGDAVDGANITKRVSTDAQ